MIFLAFVYGNFFALLGFKHRNLHNIAEQMILEYSDIAENAQRIYKLVTRDAPARQRIKALGYMHRVNASASLFAEIPVNINKIPAVGQNVLRQFFRKTNIAENNLKPRLPL